MLRQDDPVYYKVKLQELFNQAQRNGLEIELGMKEVSFINNTSSQDNSRGIYCDCGNFIE
ncbi:MULTISPECIES: hypothetical protein [unclassified Clostridium]|uniref:hypothetical protein n=1 Tax=unclassified Clostridium TaxID=2614128 RepID=UPI0025BFB83B|nr:MULTISPECIES: hypothetical protein [unclassified Clostridium]